jgi:hypothetical protein
MGDVFDTANSEIPRYDEAAKYKEAMLEPVEILGLSDNAISALKSLGMELVSDCIDFAYRAEVDHYGGHVPPDTLITILDEVMPRIKELGYWSTPVSS